DAPAVGRPDVAPRDARMLTHHIEPERRVVRERDVEVAGRPGHAGAPALDRFQIERIAVIVAVVAHAVDVEVVLRIEAADRERVALRAALAGGQADPADVTQRVAHAGRALILEGLLRDD